MDDFTKKEVLLHEDFLENVSMEPTGSFTSLGAGGVFEVFLVGIFFKSTFQQPNIYLLCEGHRCDLCDFTYCKSEQVLLGFIISQEVAQDGQWFHGQFGTRDG